jgi:hypothetical protein
MSSEPGLSAAAGLGQVMEDKGTSPPGGQQSGIGGAAHVHPDPAERFGGLKLPPSPLHNLQICMPTTASRQDDAQCITVHAGVASIGRYRPYLLRIGLG